VHEEVSRRVKYQQTNQRKRLLKKKIATFAAVNHEQDDKVTSINSR
jgi:hypothetical protein